MIICVTTLPPAHASFVGDIVGKVKQNSVVQAVTGVVGTIKNKISSQKEEPGENGLLTQRLIDTTYDTFLTNLNGWYPNLVAFNTKFVSFLQTYNIHEQSIFH